MNPKKGRYGKTFYRALDVSALRKSSEEEIKFRRRLSIFQPNSRYRSLWKASKARLATAKVMEEAVNAN
jgi:hypothetical protein